VKTLLLTKKDAKRITSIGTGNQARMQIRAISEIMKIEEIHAWDNSPKSLSAYKRDIEIEFGIPVVMASSEKAAVEQAAVEQADILITTTRGKGSLVEADWVKPGTHIVAIGTDQRGKRELDPEIFRNAKVVVDSLSQCIEKGETWHPLDRNIIAKEGVYAEIGEILLGRKPGRESDAEVTIFDSTGMAIQENITAGKIYFNALERNTGTYFEFLNT
jgi:alanine dehydrogenase